MSSADALTVFLRERLEEDNVAALLAELEDQLRDRQTNFIASGDDEPADGRRRFIAQFPVSRMRVDIFARRQLVELHADGVHQCPGRRLGGEPCVTLRLLGLVYAGHPGFDQQWRP